MKAFKNYYSPGKVMLTGEYSVLKGAKALSLPSKMGQALSLENHEQIEWQALDHKEETWFWAKWDNELNNLDTNNPEAAQIIETIFKQAKESFYQNKKFITKVEFPREFGLGTSSTLISNISQALDLEPFSLLWKTFGGSGYDLATALEKSSLIYSIENKEPKWEKVTFAPSFSDQLYFIHLEKKMNSREGIKKFEKQYSKKPKIISEISKLTEEIIHVQKIEEFEKILEQHEQLTSILIDQPTIKEQYFKDYNGMIKSLGAWGGDLILTSSPQGPEYIFKYFNNKGFPNILSFEEII